MTLPPQDCLPQDRPALRILTCGSVDDGKSTLIGRLLYERNLIHEDQLAALARDSRRYGTDGDEIDFALLLDGLEAEREQGITIDVAYRYFATSGRSFIVADAPGHEHYTRNMVTGASNADVAILLVDARKGLLTQTLRHATIASLLGVPRIVLAVNKMDLVDFSQPVFDGIAAAFNAAAAHLDVKGVQAIPLAARRGDNIASLSTHMPWYIGPTLIEMLERCDVEETASLPLRFPVQWVNRPDSDFRGLSGTIVSGRLLVGEAVAVAPRGHVTRIARIVTMDGDRTEAAAPDAVTLVLADDIDVSRGDIIAASVDRPTVADQFAAHLIWLGDEPLFPGRSYLLRTAGRTVSATVTEIKHRLDVTNFAHVSTKSLDANDIGFCNLSTTSPVCFDAYRENRATGGFLLIDRYTNATMAAGLISFALRRASNIHVQQLSISRETRAHIKHQSPAVLWFTGLSGAGKSTIANLVEARLVAHGAHTALLDGDNIRHGLSRDLGFTAADRVENIRRIGEVARLMTDAGLVVLCAFISPFRAERDLVRDILPAGEFVEIFIDTPLEICIARDAKGLYKRALAGEIKNFTGVDQPYEPPHAPDLRVAGEQPAEEAADRIIDWLLERGIVR